MEHEQYEKLFPHLWRFALSIARHEQEANDLVQEAWLRALNNENVWTLAHHQQKAWFFKTMKRLLIDERRKRKRDTPYEPTQHETFFPSFNPFDNMEMMELLGSLPEVQQTIVFQKFWLGFSSEEIGRQLSLPASTVRSKLRTALAKLRKQM
ncbi:RNA polymerase sigma factor [Natribacillus halophilus]|uniref:RNA polymerase sigma-70 factor, ECF subfamily n=1 Tax=Natribacillus halophilus TaxID=549003 RepID=A0A1G8J730_9BACI|nr:RNA polymerase sigma factor [Natribacillus halophilus]SDI26911.1 RNA polymerase sigma-70 factor, ECF subfamily [Natribacillus halophilus]